MSEMLFGDSEHNQSEARRRPDPDSQGLPAWQVDSLRAAFDKTGLTGQDERKKTVEQILGRTVAALRELTHAEAGQVRDALHAQMTAADDRGDSAWDQRDEDTWIDRL
jgi:hypothetical protein